MATVTEIAPDVFRICTFIPEVNLGFSQFLVRDEQPLLFETGMRALFPAVREAVATVLDPASIRWIGFSHFEADECGSLNDWLTLAPQAEAACSFVGAQVSVNDFIGGEARGLQDGEVIETGAYRFRFCRTPQVPHCWEAGVLFEETQGTLLCSDLFHQLGDVEPLTDSDVIGRAREALVQYQAGPFADYMPYTRRTGGILQSLADLKPTTIATMHGSAFHGDGERALRDFAAMVGETLGP